MRVAKVLGWNWDEWCDLRIGERESWGGAAVASSGVNCADAPPFAQKPRLDFLYFSKQSFKAIGGRPGDFNLPSNAQFDYPVMCPIY